MTCHNRAVLCSVCVSVCVSLLLLPHISISERWEITGYVTAHHTERAYEPAALRDMTTKPSEQLFPGMNGPAARKGQQLNDSQFPSEWNLRKNNRPVIELHPGTFEPQ